MGEKRNFWELYDACRPKGNLCIGLDPVLDLVPLSIEGTTEARVRYFLDCIIQATRDFARCYNINPAFFPISGTSPSLIGWVVQRIRFLAPRTPIMYNAGLRDIRHSNEEWARRIFDELECDAITVNPLAGKAHLLPFLEREDKGIFVWCFSLSSGSVPDESQAASIIRRCYRRYTVSWCGYVANRVATDWNERNNCGLVMGVDNPDAIATVRKVVGDKMPILITGDVSLERECYLKKAVRAGVGESGEGEIIVNVSRDILFSSLQPDFDRAAGGKAERFRDLIGAVISAMFSAESLF